MINVKEAIQDHSLPGMPTVKLDAQFPPYRLARQLIVEKNSDLRKGRRSISRRGQSAGGFLGGLLNDKGVVGVEVGEHRFWRKATEKDAAAGEIIVYSIDGASAHVPHLASIDLAIFPQEQTARATDHEAPRLRRLIRHLRSPQRTLAHS